MNIMVLERFLTLEQTRIIGCAIIVFLWIYYAKRINAKNHNGIRGIALLNIAGWSVLLLGSIYPFTSNNDAFAILIVINFFTGYGVWKHVDKHFTEAQKLAIKKFKRDWKKRR